MRIKQSGYILPKKKKEIVNLPHFFLWGSHSFPIKCVRKKNSSQKDLKLGQC